MLTRGEAQLTNTFYGHNKRFYYPTSNSAELWDFSHLVQNKGSIILLNFVPEGINLESLNSTKEVGRRNSKFLILFIATVYICPELFWTDTKCCENIFANLPRGELVFIPCTIIKTNWFRWAHLTYIIQIKNRSHDFFLFCINGI